VNKIIRKASLLTLSASMLLMAACGVSVKTEDGANGNSQTAAAEVVMSAEEYVHSVDTWVEDINESNSAVRNLDQTDSAAIAAYTDETTAIYQEMIDAAAPEEFAEAHEKLSQGAQQMIEYLNALPEFFAIADTADYEEARWELFALSTEAQNNIEEGLALLHADAEQ